jgi:hypothetical protein
MYEHAKKLIERLTANSPVVSGETENLLFMLRNMTHFFRILGKKDLTLIQHVLSGEREIIEPSMSMLFQWVIMDMEREQGEISVSLEQLYEYAGFLLNTLGGKAYLARRDSRTRILITYYSIIILDMANKKRLNRYGIDIKPSLDLAIDDISRYSGLEDKDHYLKKLREIRRTLKSRI